MSIAEMIENLRKARDEGRLDPVTANTVIAFLREHGREEDEHES